MQATVREVYFAAWWPASMTGETVERPAETYDVTLTDGRVLRDVPHDLP